MSYKLACEGQTCSCISSVLENGSFDVKLAVRTKLGDKSLFGDTAPAIGFWLVKKNNFFGYSFGVVQIRNIAIPCAIQLTLSDLRVVQISETDGGPEQAGVGEISAGEVGALEVGFPEAGAGEVGAGEVGAAEVGAGELGTGEVGVGEVGSGEVGAVEVGAEEIGAGEVGVVELGFGEVGAG